jgi:hypothetical protein
VAQLEAMLRRAGALRSRAAAAVGRFNMHTCKTDSITICVSAASDM